MDTKDMNDSSRIAILSDIHGNLSALKNVLKDADEMGVNRFIILGDTIDYGMHSNEVIDVLRTIDDKVICNIWGNHESAVMNDDYDRFSSERGRNCARYTKSKLSEGSFDYMRDSMDSSAVKELAIAGKRVLCVHGDIFDRYWGTVSASSDKSAYAEFDYVLSGHSHVPHFFEQYYAADDPKRKNKRKCTFINPGSIGQPRNLDTRSQYCILDTASGEISFRKVEYDIQSEMDAFDGNVDDYYKERLRYGI